MIRTHTCGELRREDSNQNITLAGWVHSRRDFGGVIFIDIRDRYGITQVTFNGEKNATLCQAASDLRQESVVQINGHVVVRPESMINSSLPTGEIEIEAAELIVLSTAEVLPFEINNEETMATVKESLRLEYRFLDLRRPKLQAMLKAKDDLFQYLRSYFQSHNFVEVQTPILANSSPEGARDFLIPSRFYPGSFYALPQAPQQFKQLLMVGGVDRYFQIAPCFRDEDTRHDRHYGEFYQLDMEMSFATQDDIFEIMEPVMQQITEKFSSKKIINLEANGSFRRLAWKESMEMYGSDKPDLRYDLSIQSISSVVENKGFAGFDEALQHQGVVHALRIPGGATFTRKIIDEIKELAGKKSIQAFATLLVEENGEVKSSLSKFLDQTTLDSIAEKVLAKPGDQVIMISGQWRNVCEAFGLVRSFCATQLNLIDKSSAAWCWIVDFPMYDHSEIKPGAIDFGHNPFSMPQGGHEAIDTKHPLDILAYQYDLVLNGYEISSGGVRNHDPELLKKVFIKAGYEAEEVERRFGAMIKAFRYGVPPHAGNAPGVDRLLMVLNDWDSIRDLYAFPKDGQGRDVLMNSPSEVNPEQLRELGLSQIKS
ncbi:aspartate--tRNA ligase [Candidatus Falkowbacteria bacterium]|nr:MAG: aspartate--tRNA ligase [Candidatus Falkowbacteria bacterium]